MKCALKLTANLFNNQSYCYALHGEIDKRLRTNGEAVRNFFNQHKNKNNEKNNNYGRKIFK